MSPLRTIASGLRFPEGPVAMADGSVILVEIARGTVTRIAPDGSTSVVAEPGGGPNGAALGPDGALYVCNNGGFLWHDKPGLLRPVGTPDDYGGGRIERIDLTTGTVEILYDRCGENRLSGPNDIVFDRQGGFYFTDLGKIRRRDRDHGAVYYAKADGSFIAEIVHPLLTPNGIGLSPDESTLYVADSETARLWSFAIASPGILKRHPFPSLGGGQMLYNQPGLALYDSLAVDALGNICVATLMTGHITVISPEGELVRQVKMPETYPTNICFGGPDLRTAFITLSGSGRLVAMDWPEPGLKLSFAA